MNNDYVYTVIRNGFGFNSAAALGCESDYDAFVATKQAVYAVLYGYDVNTYFASTGTARSNKIVNCIRWLVSQAYNSTVSSSNPSVSVAKTGDLTEKTIGDTVYYVQKYDVTTTSSTVPYESFNINLSGFTASTVVYNTDFTSTISGSTNVSSFYVCTPKSEVDHSFTGVVKITDVRYKCYPVLYGNTTVAGTQNYALVGDPYLNRSAYTNQAMKLPDVDVIKTERDFEPESVLAGAEYDIVDLETEEVVRHVGPTDEDGKIVVTELPAGEYKLVETVAPVGYNLDSDEPTFEVDPNTADITLNTDDSVIKSTLEITKTAKTNSEITGVSAGTALADTTFEVYAAEDIYSGSILVYAEGDLIDTVTTDSTGSVSIDLRYGTYTIKEVNPPEYFLNDSEDQTFTISENGQIIPVVFSNCAVRLSLLIEKTGLVQAQPNDEIRYDFTTLKNDSNVPVDNFTWEDNLPYEYIQLTKLYTGTYNEDLDYTVWYKVEGSNDYIQYKNPNSEDGTYNTQKNNYIDFTSVGDVKITDYKLCFGTVKEGFAANEGDKPFIFAKVRSTVKGTDSWINHTKLTGSYTSNHNNTLQLESSDDWETGSYAKKLSISKLPKTGE